MATKKEALTMEQLIEKMAEVRAAAEEARLAYNDCEEKDEADRLMDAIKESKKQYNEYSRQKALLECLATENPIVEACTRSVYPTIRTTSEKLENGSKVLNIEDNTTLIDLTGFNRSLLNGWYYRAELLCLLMTKDAAAALGYPKQKIGTIVKCSKTAVMVLWDNGYEPVYS